MGITNYRDATRSQSFTYDALNRLTSGWSAANTGAMSWGETYSIDAWGNLMIAPMANKAHGGNFQLAGDVNNRAAGLGYDAAGNLTNYTAPGQGVYDQENRLQSTAGMTYTYDASGQRVLKSNTSTGAAVQRYWSSGGNVVAEGDGTGNITSEYVYLGGKRVTRIDLAADSVHYYLSDHLNTTSVVATAAGGIEEESDYYPFGTEVMVTGPGANHYKFAGKERDQESGLDYLGARYFGSALGRFVTPDSTSYSTLRDPQRWNLYSYVMNNPLRYNDPDGHAAECKTDATKCLAGAQAAVANKEAASRLYINKVPTQHSFLGYKWTTTRDFLGIKGDVKSFAALSGNAARMASMVSDDRVFSLNVTSWLSSPSAAGNTPLRGGGWTRTQHQDGVNESFVDPNPPKAGVDQDAERDHIPPANLGEKVAHEFLGHEWGEAIMGHNASTPANAKDAIDAENAVRATDPSRGQKTEHWKRSN